MLLLLFLLPLHIYKSKVPNCRLNNIPYEDILNKNEYDN